MLSVRKSDGCIPGPVLSPLYREQPPLRGSLEYTARNCLPLSLPLCHPRACLICPLPSCRSLHTENASFPQNICVWMNLSPCFSVFQTAANLDISCPEGLLMFRGRLCHVFLTSLAFCALPRSLILSLGVEQSGKQQRKWGQPVRLVRERIWGGRRLYAFHWVVWEYSRSYEVNFQKVLPTLLASCYKMELPAYQRALTHVLNERRSEWIIVFAGARILGWWGAGAVGNRCWEQD